MSEFTPNDSGAATEIDTIREPGARSRGGVVGWMSRHPVILAVLGLLVVLALGVFAFSRNAENRYQRLISEIRARGEPTTVEEVIAATPGLPDEENALLRVLDAWREIDKLKLTDEQNKLLPWVGMGDAGATGTRLTTDQLTALGQYLNDIQSPLAQLEESLSNGQGLYRPAIATPIVNTLMPELAEIRQVAKLLGATAEYEAADGGGQQAEGRLRALFQVSQMVDGKRGLISMLVNIAIVSIAQTQTERCINSNALEADSLQRIEASLNAQQTHTLMRDAYVAERVLFLDAVKWMKSSPANLTNADYGTRLIRHLPGASAMQCIDALRFYADFIDAVTTPTGAALKRIDSIVRQSEQLSGFSLYLSIVAPSLRRAAELWVRSEGMQRALLTAIACERYRLKHGKWPEKLDALVPDYFDAVPLDPFDEKPIRFARIPEGTKVWSIGEDFVDNGGDVRRLDPDPKKRPTDWGWVILDPPLRNRPADAAATTRPAGP